MIPRRPLVAMVLVGAAVVGAAAVPAGDGARRDTIVFSGGNAGISFGFGGDAGSIDGISVNLQPSTGALPTKLVIDVPAGFKLALDAPLGTKVGRGRVNMISDSGSFANGTDDLVVTDPASPTAVASAAACAPGRHAAIWASAISIAGQDVGLTFFVDPATDPSLAYVLQACPTGLGAVHGRSQTTIELAELAGFTEPAATGMYVWRALITPTDLPTYEMQALVPKPESLTVVQAGPVVKGHVTLTGRVVEGGQPAEDVDISVARITQNSISGLGSDRLATDASGRFSTRVAVRQTSDFEVSASGSSTPCTIPSTAPGGCIGSTSVPPPDAFATVWVSVPGGATRAFNARAQGQAAKENVQASELPDGFSGSGPQPHGCLSPKGESSLTIAGESTTPQLLHYGVSADGTAPEIVALGGLVRVYATPAQAAKAFADAATAKNVRCAFPTARKLKLAPIREGHGRAGFAGFRIQATEDGIVERLDRVYLVRGRSVAVLTFVAYGATSDLEPKVVVAVAKRLY